MSIGLVILFK